MRRSKRTKTQPASAAEARSKQLSLGLPTEVRMEDVVCANNIKRAFARVKANRGAPGVDGQSIEDFPAWAREHWPHIRQQLLDGTYRPSPVRRKTISKPDGSPRMLGIPTVLDRVIQQAIHQVVMPLFDPDFSESSFGFRPKRSAHGAVKQVQGYVKRGYGVAVDLDLAKFFDTVHHDVLMARVARKVRDKRVLGLMGRYLRADVMVDGVLQPVQVGTPQGGPLSPLLSNILLDDLDKELERRGLRFARYADDFVILVRTQRAGRRVYASVKRWLETRLKLRVNTRKSQVASINRTTFLGFAFAGRLARLPPKVLERLRHRVRYLTGRSRGVSWERRLRELNAFLRGWMGYYGLCNTTRTWTPMDQWIRRRLRMCLWKQWRNPRTRARHLLKLGTERSVALRAAVSRKGYWRLSKTLATHTGLTNKWLDQQGLVRLRYLWGDLAPLRRTA